MNVNSSSNRGEAILAALKTQFPGAVLDEERQTPEQVTITVKINLLPDVVHYLYYQHDGWLPILFGNDERTLNGHYAVYYALSMEGAEKCWIVGKALGVSVSHPARPCRGLGRARNSRYVRADSGWPAGSASPGVAR
mgnify:CR=1 FL=1